MQINDKKQAQKGTHKNSFYIAQKRRTVSSPKEILDAEENHKQEKITQAAENSFVDGQKCCPVEIF